jgi:hypothetical protein
VQKLAEAKEQHEQHIAETNAENKRRVQDTQRRLSETQERSERLSANLASLGQQQQDQKREHATALASQCVAQKELQAQVEVYPRPQISVQSQRKKSRTQAVDGSKRWVTPESGGVSVSSSPATGEWGGGSRRIKNDTQSAERGVYNDNKRSRARAACAFARPARARVS